MCTLRSGILGIAFRPPEESAMPHRRMEAIPYQPAPAPTGDTLILNVDDSEERLRYRSTVLRDVGFDVLEACTGTEALAAAARTRPALILLDVHLPAFDGFEVCARPTPRPSPRDIPGLPVAGALALA